MRKFLFAILMFSINLGFTNSSYCSSGTGKTSLEGKGMFLWHLWTQDGGGKNLNYIIDTLHLTGTNWLVVKMGDSDSYYYRPGKDMYSWATTYYGSMDSVVSIFHANGIKLLAYQYVRGVPHYYGNTASETDVANSILSIKGIDGLIIDAEAEYENLSTKVAAASAYCDSIHAHHPDAFLGLTSFARVDGHNAFPWTTFLDRVDVNMPQTYWAARPTTPQNELSIMNSQFTSWTNTWVGLGDTAADKPIMPLGQGEYFGYSNDVKQGEITSFCSLSQTTYKYPGVSLWEYSQITHAYVWDEYTAAWQITSVLDQPNKPDNYNLSQNYPNPFNPSTTINYVVPNRNLVVIKLYTILGKEIATLVNEEKAAGHYSIQFSADRYNLSSGVYFYRMSAGNFVETKKLILMK